VRDEDQGRGQAAELLLEPRDGAGVEVVRGLVEDQELGPAEERARERHAPAFADGQRAHERVSRRQREGRRDRPHGVVLAPASERVDPLVERRERFDGGVERGTGEARQLLLEGRDVRERLRVGRESGAHGREHGRGGVEASDRSRRRVTSPRSGSSSPTSTRSRLDLPAPLMPTTPTRSRSAIANEAPTRTCRVPKARCTSCAVSSVVTPGA